MTAVPAAALDAPAPPEVLDLGGGLRLVRTTAADADALHDVIEVNRDHLRPWMAWADQDRAATIDHVGRTALEWERGTTFNYLVVDGPAIVGAAGLHRRGCADVLEIGYWLAAAATGRGIMTSATRSLADAAVTLDGVRRVAIRCDHRNRPSSAVAARCGFSLLGDELTTAGERHEVWEWWPDRLVPFAVSPVVTVRPARAADADALVELFGAVAGEGRWIGGELPLTEARIDGLRGSAARPADDAAQATIVADDDGAIVGWLAVYRAGPGRAALGMALAASHRGQGLGRRLLDRAVGWARTHELHKVDLEVWPHNDRARALYRSTGFREEGYRPRHWRRNDGSLWDSIEMSLVIDAWSPGGPPP